jgi:hypothetical protein
MPNGYEMAYEIWGTDEIRDDDGGTAPFGFVARKQGSSDLVFAMRGVEGDIEWAEDIFEASQTACPVQNSKGMVHQAFGSIYESLTFIPAGGNSPAPPPIGTGDTLRQVVLGAESVAVTGHSLGGALATLLAADIALNPRTPISAVYTFASPRTGNGDFTRLFNELVPSQSFRVANVWDIVPHLPPKDFGTLDGEWYYDHVRFYCPVDGGRTTDVVASHSLAAVEKGLRRLLNPTR